MVIVEMADQIDRITAEWVRAELDKLIGADHPIVGINLMCDTGLAQRVLPDAPALFTLVATLLFGRVRRMSCSGAVGIHRYGDSAALPGVTSA